MQNQALQEIVAKLPQSVQWKNGELYFLDQTKLPLEFVVEKQETAQQVFQSIKMLKVRGAPAIGCGGAYGLLVAIKPHLSLAPAAFMAKAQELADYLNSSRPTAVNLSWALKRMMATARAHQDKSSQEIYQILVNEAETIYQEDADCCTRIGQHGEPLIKEGMGVLTHCNAGHLAVSMLGTALSPLYTAHAAGRKFRVYADETRPLLQGARLTSWELQQAGIDVTLICDNMAGHLMSQGKIDLVIVGTDRVAANGDVANKIGTHSVAILAKHFGIPFYVACPYSTIDLNTPSGKEIEIEQRGAEEVCHFGERRTAPLNMKVENPAFDVTPNALVHGIITERGILRPPYLESLKQAGSYEKG